MFRRNFCQLLPRNLDKNKDNLVNHTRTEYRKEHEKSENRNARQGSKQERPTNNGRPVEERQQGECLNILSVITFSSLILPLPQGREGLFFPFFSPLFYFLPLSPRTQRSAVVPKRFSPPCTPYSFAHKFCLVSRLTFGACKTQVSLKVYCILRILLCIFLPSSRIFLLRFQGTSSQNEGS